MRTSSIRPLKPSEIWALLWPMCSGWVPARMLWASVELMVFASTPTLAQSILAGTQPLHIGQSNAQISEGFNGLIDEVRIYNRVLSGDEITADMSTPIVP